MRLYKIPFTPITKPPSLPFLAPPPFLAKFFHPPITAIFEKSHPPFTKEGGGRGGGRGVDSDYEVTKKLTVEIDVSIYGNNSYIYRSGFHNLLSTLNFPKMTILEALKYKIAESSELA